MDCSWGITQRSCLSHPNSWESLDITTKADDLLNLIEYPGSLSQKGPITIDYVHANSMIDLSFGSVLDGAG